MAEEHTKMLESVLKRAGLPFKSCWLGRQGTTTVVCWSDAAARKVAGLLTDAGWHLRGITQGIATNKVQKGTRLIENHDTQTVHARL